MRTSEEMQLYNRIKRSTDDLYGSQSYSSADNMPFTFLISVFGGMAIFVILCIIIKCFYNICTTLPQSGPRPNPLPKRTTRQCNHAPCVINRSSNNWNKCLFEINGSQCSGAPHISHSANHFGDTATISSLNTHRLNLPTTCDNYCTSATMARWSHASGSHQRSQASNGGFSTAPPSYAEALADTFAAGTSTAQHYHHAAAYHDNAGFDSGSAWGASGGGGGGGDNGGGRGGDSGGGGGGDSGGGGGGDSGGGGGGGGDSGGGGGGDSGGGGGTD